MMRDFHTNIIGKFWQEQDLWIARIEGLQLEVTGPTPYRTLQKIVDLVVTAEKRENVDYSISIVDSGFFYLKIKRKTDENLS